MGWLYVVQRKATKDRCAHRRATPCVAAPCVRHRVQPPMGWLYVMQRNATTHRRAHRRATPCVAAPCTRHRVQPPMGWLYVVQRNATTDRRAHRRATPCVAAPQSGTACSHPWGGSTWCNEMPRQTGARTVEPRHAWLRFNRHRVQPPMGWLYVVQRKTTADRRAHRRATPCVAAPYTQIATPGAPIAPASAATRGMALHCNPGTQSRPYAPDG